MRQGLRGGPGGVGVPHKGTLRSHVLARGLFHPGLRVPGEGPGLGSPQATANHKHAICGLWHFKKN